MEDFREIVGFLIIGIGIVLSVLKERKDKKKTEAANPTQQNTPILRKTRGIQHSSPSPAITTPPEAITNPPEAITNPTQRANPHRHPQSGPEIELLPLIVTSTAKRARQEQTQTSSFNAQESHKKESNVYQNLPEEGVRVTQDIPPMEPISDYNAQEEEELIEKLREGVILSEILKRKF